MAAVTIVRHRVQDYDAWKRVYDSVKPLQQAGGVMAHGVFRSIDDPSMVTVLHTFETADKARTFFGNEELKQAMVNAGVDMSTFQLDIADEIAFGRL